MTSTNVLDRLDRDWTERYATVELDYGPLGISTGECMVHVIQQGQSQERDRLLHVLLSKATLQRDDVAVYTLVRTMRAMILSKARGIHRTAHVGAGSDFAACVNLAVGVFWEVVTTFPLHRQQHLCGNVSGEMLKRLSHDFGGRFLEHEVLVCDEEVARLQGQAARQKSPNTSEAGESPDNAQSLSDLLSVLTWATAHGVLSEEKAQLLGQYGSSDKAERHALAQSRGLTPVQLQKKIDHYRRAITAGVRRMGLSREDLAA